MAYKEFRTYAELRAAYGLPDPDDRVKGLVRKATAGETVTVNDFRAAVDLPPLPGAQGEQPVRLGDGESVRLSGVAFPVEELPGR